MTDVLLSDHISSRVGAVKHFQQLTSLPLNLVSRSIRLLNQVENDISSSDLKTWQAAALKLHDAIREDLLCTVAGARQAIEERYEDGIREYFPALLRPNLNSLNTLEVDILKPEGPRETSARLVLEIVDNSESFNSACAMYLETVGFLPLEGASSFSELIRLWSDRRGPLTNAWEAIWQWVNESKSLLSTYHACSYFLDTDSSIPEGKESFIWSQLLKVFDTPSDSGQNNDHTSEWKLRSELARHYLQYLEVRLPGVQGDGFARVALWLVEKIATLVNRDPATIERIRNIAIIPEAFDSEFAWRVTNPPLNQAPLNLATYGLVSVWALSLLSKITRPALGALKAGIPEETRENFEKTITNLFLRGFPLRPKTSDQIVYAFEGPVESVIDTWTAEYGESERMKFVRVINALHLKLIDPSEFSSVFKTLSDEKSEADQLLIANWTGVLAKQGILPLESVWECLSDTEWREKVFSKLPENALEMLFMAFAVSLDRGGKLWMTELPHIYARAYKDCVVDKERSDLFFGWMLLTCVHTYSVSAIESLLSGGRAESFLEHIARWRRVFIDHTKNSPPWATARSRAILAALNPV
jgi:hypothetical protein